MNAKTMTITTAAFALALAAGLAACSSDATPAPVPSVTASATQAPVAEPSDDATTDAPATVPLETGATITPEQAQTLMEGQTGFELADGTIIVVTATEPLPDLVRADIAVQVTETYVAGNGPTSSNAAASLARSLSRETGKSILVISQSFASINPNDEPSEIWSTQGQSTLIQGTADRDSQIANAQAWIAAQPDAALWDYVVKG